MGLHDDYWTPERTKAFWEEMKICKGQRADGKDGKCIDSQRHNRGCVGCTIGDGGLYEPELLEETVPPVKYVLVSQGVKIFETTDEKEAQTMMDTSNLEWQRYREKCMENNEPYADNEIEMITENPQQEADT